MEQMSFASVTPGYCRCGCGQKTRIAKKTDRKVGIIAGKPRRYLPHHHRRGKSFLLKIKGTVHIPFLQNLPSSQWMIDRDPENML